MLARGTAGCGLVLGEAPGFSAPPCPPVPCHPQILAKPPPSSAPRHSPGPGAGGPPSSAGGGGRPEGQASSYLLLIPDFLHVTWEAKLALLSHLKHFRGGRGQQLPPGPQGRLRGCGPEGRSQGRKEQV